MSLLFPDRVDDDAIRGFVEDLGLLAAVEVDAGSGRVNDGGFDRHARHPDRHQLGQDLAVDDGRALAIEVEMEGLVAMEDVAGGAEVRSLVPRVGEFDRDGRVTGHVVKKPDTFHWRGRVRGRGLGGGDRPSSRRRSPTSLRAE